MPPPQPPQDATDIFSITDEVLAERLQFIEEVRRNSTVSVVFQSVDTEVIRLGLEIGVVFGYVAQDPILRRRQTCQIPTRR